MSWCFKITFLYALMFSVQAFAMDFDNIGEHKKSYSIYLMWVKEVSNDDDTYIFPEEKVLNCTETIIEWANKNPKSDGICIWYDCKTTNEMQVENTHRLFNDKYPNTGSRLNLCSLRNFPLMQQHEEAFSEKMPIFFRADLWRVVIADPIINQECSSKYIVYSDFNIPPLSHDELFERDTLEKLKYWGLVLAQDNAKHLSRNEILYENSFYILDRENIPMVKACRLGLIDINIQRALASIHRGESYNPSESFDSLNNKKIHREFSEIVWSSYAQMIKLFHYFNLGGDIGDEPQLNPPTSELRLAIYNNCEDLFSTETINAKFKLKLNQGSYKKYCKELQQRVEIINWLIVEEEENLDSYLPTKQVNKPESRFYSSSYSSI